MSAFKDIDEPRVAKQTPPRVVWVSPSAFASDWTSRPRDKVPVGVRLLSEREVQTAKGEAEKYALELLSGQDKEGYVEAYNDALVRYAVALGTTKPDDVEATYFTAAEDTVHQKLTTDGLRHLFEQMTLLVVEYSPLHPEASDHEISLLASWLSEPAKLDALPPGRGKSLRRLLGYCLDRIEGPAGG